MKTPVVALTLFIAIAPSTLLAQSGQFDGVWTGNAIENGSSMDCDGVTPVVIKVNGTQILGTGYDFESDAEDFPLVSGILDDAGTISDGVFTDGVENFGTFAGTFSGAAAQITFESLDLPGCNGTLALTRQVSFTSGFDELWSGSATILQGEDCDGSAELTLARTSNLAFAGSGVATNGEVYLVRIFIDEEGRISDGTLGTADFVGGAITGEIDTDAGTGAGEFTLGEDCSGTFGIDRTHTVNEPEPDPETENLPEGDVPAASKIVTSNGTVSSAGLAIGAYSATGTPVYASTFTAGDFVTIIGEVTPDANDIGKNGALYAAVASLVNGNLTFSFLNTDGNLEAWDLSLAGLGAATATSPLQASQAITIFEGNLGVGVHKIALAYKASGGPLIYTGKAVKVTVTQ